MNLNCTHVCNFENSKIIVHADHGWPVGIYVCTRVLQQATHDGAHMSIKTGNDVQKGLLHPVGGAFKRTCTPVASKVARMQ